MSNYYYPSSLKDLRDGFERTIDRGSTAFKVGEMMDKHGSNDWLGPLVEGLGPSLQAHIADFASLLEALSNFYNFENPYATTSSLCLVAALFLVSALGDAKLALKIWWMTVGLLFFVSFPIASRYPRYRHLVAPWKWMIWDVPTHAEWSFQYLQERAAVIKASMISASNLQASLRAATLVDAHADNDSDVESFASAVSIPFDPEHDLMSFSCTYQHTPGRLILSTSSLSFVPLASFKILPASLAPGYTSNLTTTVGFHKAYSTLIEMSKRQTHASVLKPLAKLVTGLDKLELVFKGEGRSVDIQSLGADEHAEIMVLENMRGRDKAFNAILGFSGVRWQNLQRMEENVKKR